MDYMTLFPGYTRDKPHFAALAAAVLKLGYDLAHYGADGKYGNITMREVRKFQRAQGLAVDGICGPKTWAALDREGTVHFGR